MKVIKLHKNEIKYIEQAIDLSMYLANDKCLGKRILKKLLTPKE